MIGQSLSHYKILEKLGSGGMGDVYKARDTKLGREVAIKVLPEAFAQDKERLARFEREAHLLASLNHPNIATIHDLEQSEGVHFLVLELVPGETLAERIERGPIPVDEALPLFKQIAEGLEAAHEKGVIHRDLKPANIKVTPDGKPKILDFGLAKAMAGEVPDQGLSESPTMTRGATEAGILLGTAPYMSPEQARGKAVDKRADIWAFGCCLYEALTGKTAFLGETVSDTIVVVLEHEPDWKSLAISPDGHIAAYVAEHGNASQLYLRAMDELEGRSIEGTDGARMPFFSPDSQWLGFWAGGKLMKVAVSGGAPLTIAEVGVTIRGACWTPEGEIVFMRDAGQGLSRISADGGEPEVLTTPNHDQHEKTHRLPEILPGGSAVLFTLGTGDIDSFDDASIAVLSLETGEYRVIIEGGTNARYSATGHLIYARAGYLLAVPFDLDELQVMGSPVPVLQGVLMRPNFGNAEFSVSRNGSLLYARGESWGEENRVVWVDREGQTQQLIETPRAFFDVRVSPDGRFLALLVDAANANLWVYDIARATSTRFTFGFDNQSPIWTPDGHRVTFNTTRTQPSSIFWQASDGTGQAERLTTSEHSQHPISWSPDGKILALMEANPATGWDIFVLSLDGDRTPKPFLQTNFNERAPEFSPNGRWIAYYSDESGQDEVYVRQFPSAEGKIQVSTGGGEISVWNPNGEELFYHNGDKMMVVDDSTRDLSRDLKTVEGAPSEAPLAPAKPRPRVSAGGDDKVSIYIQQARNNVACEKSCFFT